MRCFYLCTIALLLVLLTTMCRADNTNDTLHFLSGFSDLLGVTWTGTDYCSWEGVTCQLSGVTLLLSSNISACVPNNALPEAESDDILVKSISIHIPNSDCNSTFTLPESWSRLRQLKELSFLDAKGLSGTLPASWGSSMTALTTCNLGNTNISGTLPATWSAMQSLGQLSLDNTLISGPLPPGWTSMTGLYALGLSNTMVNGTLPTGWSAMQSLSWLYLDKTMISGTLPPEWVNNKKLLFFNLSNTMISGTLPPRWACFSGLQRLDLRNTSLSGPLPAAWGQSGGMSALSYLYLDGNHFCGCEPDSWRSRSVLNYAVSSLSVAWANCSSSSDSCTGYDTSVSTGTVECPTQDGDKAHFEPAQMAAALVLLLATSQLL